MDVEQIIALLKKYEAGTLTPEEKGLLESWYARQASRQRPIADAELKARLERIGSRLPLNEGPGLSSSGRHRGPLPSKRSLFRRLPRVAAAAALLLIIGAGLFFYTNTLKDKPVTVVNDISPGGNKATLTISDGRTIELNAEKKGIISGKQLTYNDGTALWDADADAGTAAEIPEITLSTPRGGQYQVTLPDGTKVWLNAASVLKYPTAFTGSNREVTFEGEAYFEVAENEAKPFIIRSPQQEIEVLGTSFNISNYREDRVSRTVLLEGRVKISAGVQTGNGFRTTATRELRPGYEAVHSAGTLQVQKADTMAATAWKTGLFIFNDEPLEEIMHKIARWYDVEVVFQGADRTERFGGGVSRYDKLSTVLSRLESAGNVDFKMTGRKVICTK